MFKTKKMIGILFAALLLGISVSGVNAAKLYFAPSTGTFVYNCPFDVDVMLDMEGQDTTAMDLKIMVDESRYTIMNFDGQGGLFRTFTKPKYITVRRGSYHGINTVYVFLTTFSPPMGVVGAGKLGTLTIMPNRGVWEMPVNFFFEQGSKGEDSNIPILSGGELVDGISEVENGYYKFVEGECAYHGASTGYMVQPSDLPFEVVKNEAIVEGSQPPSAMTNYIRQYGWYIILLLAAIALVFVVSRTRKDKKKK